MANKAISLDCLAGDWAISTTRLLSNPSSKAPFNKKVQEKRAIKKACVVQAYVNVSENVVLINGFRHFAGIITVNTVDINGGDAEPIGASAGQIQGEFGA